MTTLQKTDAALAFASFLATLISYRMGASWMWTSSWIASAVFCAASSAMGWGDKTLQMLRPIYVRLMLVARLR